MQLGAACDDPVSKLKLDISANSVSKSEKVFCNLLKNLKLAFFLDVMWNLPCSKPPVPSLSF